MKRRYRFRLLTTLSPLLYAVPGLCLRILIYLEMFCFSLLKIFLLEDRLLCGSVSRGHMVVGLFIARVYANTATYIAYMDLGDRRMHGSPSAYFACDKRSSF